MPVSTKHVTVGSMTGIGVGANSIDWETTRSVLLSWFATLTFAAVAAYTVGRLFRAR